MLIEQHLILHTDLPMAAQLGEAWIVVRNTGSEPITISRIDSATVLLPKHADDLLYFTGSWGLEFESVREKLSGPKVLETRAGRSSQGQHPWFALSGEAYTFSAAPAWSGNWIFRFEPMAPCWPTTPISTASSLASGARLKGWA